MRPDTENCGTYICNNNKKMKTKKPSQDIHNIYTLCDGGDNGLSFRNVSSCELIVPYPGVESVEGVQELVIGHVMLSTI